MLWIEKLWFELRDFDLPLYKSVSSTFVLSSQPSKLKRYDHGHIILGHAHAPDVHVLQAAVASMPLESRPCAHAPNNHVPQRPSPQHPCIVVPSGMGQIRPPHMLCEIKLGKATIFSFKKCENKFQRALSSKVFAKDSFSAKQIWTACEASGGAVPNRT